MKKLSNTETNLKKDVTNKKNVRYSLSFTIEVLLKYIVLNQPPVHSTSWKYSASTKSFLKMDKTWNHQI